MNALPFNSLKATCHPERSAMKWRAVEGPDTVCAGVSFVNLQMMPTPAASAPVSGPSTSLRSAQDDGRFYSVNLEIPLIPSKISLPEERV
jgi:hypothetical protein